MKSGSMSSYRAALSGTGADFGGERDDEVTAIMPLSGKPVLFPDGRVVRPGFYWALWLTAAPGTHEGDQLTPAPNWEVVEVWENFIGDPCEADRDEKFGVAVPGVRESQWLENFQWGERVERP